MVLRSTLWRLGRRFRTHVSGLPGRPDVVFSRHRVVVFCDGDFWHGRNWPKVRRQLAGRSNGDYWIAKIEYNRRRDRKQERAISRDGWKVLRMWETDILRDPLAAAQLVCTVLEGRTTEVRVERTRTVRRAGPVTS